MQLNEITVYNNLPKMEGPLFYFWYNVWQIKMHQNYIMYNCIITNRNRLELQLHNTRGGVECYMVTHGRVLKW